MLCEERHFVWLRKMLSSIRRFAFNLAVGTSVQPNHLPGHTFDHDYFFELPTLRTERQHLLVIGLLSPHPERVDGEFGSLSAQFCVPGALLSVETDVATRALNVPLPARLYQQEAQRELPCLLICPSRW